MRVFLFLRVFLLLAICFMAATPSTHAQGSPTDNSPGAILRQEAIALEHGEGVPRSPVLAAALYCKSARLGDAQAQYNLGWMYANGRGVARNDAIAAFFFKAAAEQGLSAAEPLLRVVASAGIESPECLREAVQPDLPVFPFPLPPKVTQTKVPTGVDFATLAPRKVFDLVMQMAPQYQVEPQLAFAIMAAESNFDSMALSPKNAQGLMQLIPETSERFKVKNAFDPSQNIRGGLAYLRWLLAYFEGDVALVAAAYNAGEGKVERYRGVPPYKETQAYVERILKAVGAQVHAFDARVTRPSPALALIRLPWLGR
jgi:hypothetical protein